MKEILVRKIYKKFNELSEKQKRKELDNMRRNNKDNFFYDDYRTFTYEEQIRDIFAEINEEEYMQGDEGKLHWESNSQGWYFQDAHDAIKGYNQFKCGIYLIEFDSAGWLDRLNVYDYVYSCCYFYKHDGISYDHIYFEEIKNESVKKRFKKFIDKLAEKADKYERRIRKVIKDFVDYYPTDEEISDYFIAHDIEFLVAEEVVA